MATLNEDVNAILVSARAILAKPESWTQQASARTNDGENVAPQSPRATCWCLTGAVDLACTRLAIPENCLPYQQARITLSDAADRRMTKDMWERAEASISYVAFNDDPDTEHADILSLVDAACAMTEDD